MFERQTRRQFVQMAAAAAASVSSGTAARLLAQNEPSQSKLADKIPFNLGLASYSLRKFNLDQTLAMTKRVGLKYIAFKSFHLPLESTQAEIQESIAKVKEAGLELYGGGVIYMNTQDEVNRAFDYAKAAGMKIIIGAPQHELLPLVNKKVQE
jgi:hypothetical protein